MKNKPSFVIKYWWDGKHVRVTLEKDGKEVKMGSFDKKEEGDN